MASKLTEQIEYPIEIVRQCREQLRVKRGLEGADSEERLRGMLGRVFEAEVTLMINMGFELEVEIALGWTREWEKDLGDWSLGKKWNEMVTSLYETNVVIYF
jgi:hypothetical protein